MATLYNMIKRAAALVALTATLAASAQVQTLPTMGVAGRVLRYYDVRTGDSVYSVARDLGITVDQIIANNPSAADGLTPGMRLVWPRVRRSMKPLPLQSLMLPPPSRGSLRAPVMKSIRLLPARHFSPSPTREAPLLMQSRWRIPISTSPHIPKGMRYMCLLPE